MERGSPFLMSGRGMATALRVLVAVHCDNENGAHEHLSGCAPADGQLNRSFIFEFAL